MSEGIRNGFRTSVIAVAVAVGGALWGCASRPPQAPPTAAAKPRETLYQPPVDQILKSSLLDFEGPYDSTFVDASNVTLAIDPARPGNHALVADNDARLKLGSLVRGRDFGGSWDVVGVRLWADAATTCDVEITVDGHRRAATRVSVPARSWSIAWLDVSRTATTAPASQSTTTTVDELEMHVSFAGHHARLLLDDVVLGQSRTVVSASRLPKTNEAWTVARAGLQWHAAVDGKPYFDLPAAPFAANGYAVDEATPTRAVFKNASGTVVSIDRTGRLIENGVAKFDPRVLKVGKTVAENASPAKIEVVNEEGRVERSSPGDRDNDGYDERRGCYIVHAINGRATVRLTRQAAPVKWPVLEVLDLPPGQISVWLEGELLNDAVRCDDGRVTIELPIELATPVEVQVRVK